MKIFKMIRILFRLSVWRVFLPLIRFVSMLIWYLIILLDLFVVKGTFSKTNQDKDETVPLILFRH